MKSPRPIALVVGVFLSAAVAHATEPGGTTIERKLHPNGKVKTELPIVNDEVHGVARGYYESGAKHWESSYARGKRHGPTRFFYETGRLESEREYRNGKKHGKFVDYHPNGKKAAEGSYADDVLVKITEWDESGKTLPPEP